MTLNELIARLEELRDEFGTAPVVLSDTFSTKPVDMALTWEIMGGPRFVVLQ